MQKESAEHQKKIDLLLESIEIFEKSKNESKGPFLLIDNTKSNGSNRTSIFKEDDLKYIRKRKDGRYEFRRMFDGEKYHCINRDREVVRKFATSINKKIKNLINGVKEENNITFYDYAVNFYTLYKEKKLSGKSKTEYDLAHKTFKEKFNKPFRRIRADDFQKFLNEVETEHPTSSLKFFNKIRAVCKRAYVEGVIDKNIGEIIVKPDVKYNIRRALTLEEQKLFLQKLEGKPHDFKVFCLFCLVTSARREEAVSLERKHYNAQDGTLFINGTKTLNAPRTIRVTKEFVALLESIDFKFKCQGKYYSDMAKEIFIEMGSEDLTLNCLRHTCSTNMVYLGIPPDYRKHIMGHSTILTTDRVYTHIDPKVKKSDIENLYPGLYFTEFPHS